MNLKTNDIVLCALFAALTSILSQISIPLPFTSVPLTMQIFAVALAGMVLGSKKGFISIVIYLLIGAIGLPVFAQFSGGLGIILGPTGGFLIGCPFMALVIGYTTERTKSMIYIFISMVFGLFIVYTTGTVIFSIITKSTLYQSLIACVLPFVIVDLIKLVLASAVGKEVSKRIKTGVKVC